MKGRLRRGLALLLTLCLLSGNIAFAAEPPAQSAETSISEEAPTQNGETLPRENETEVPEKNEAEVSEGSTENAPAGHEGELEVAPEHTPETLREGAPEEGEHILNIQVFRRVFASPFENLSSVYEGYWKNQTVDPNPVYDEGTDDLRDFAIEHELKVVDTGQSITKEMTYVADTYSWNTMIDFKVKVPYHDVEVVYDPVGEDDWVKPYLLHYELRLEKGNGKMILKVPKLKSSTSQVPSGMNQILKVTCNVQTLDTLYLNGETGNDNNAGIEPGQPLKNFAKAKALALTKRGIKQIVVMGKTPLSGEISLEGIPIKRSENYKGYLFSVLEGETASLSNIVIDGNGSLDEDVKEGIQKSLIELTPGSTLEIKDGADLKNNTMKRIGKTETWGGAIYANQATVVMTGGVVEGNLATYGGGIYLSKSTMKFSGGVVQNNHSQLVPFPIEEEFYSAGGGICADNGSTIYLSDNAQILNNHAAENGGGISLGKSNKLDNSVLHMTGGTIAGNTAGASGGGLFVQCESQAWISAGTIKDNQMTGKGFSEKRFGGGGIYVNGHKDYENGKLVLKNAVIANNKANGTIKYSVNGQLKQDLGSGGGYAACPTTDTKIYVTDGVAIYQNEARSNGKDLYILAYKDYGEHGGEPTYDLSLRMLGGALWNWEYDDRGYVIHAGGNELPLYKYKGKIPHNGTSDDLPLLTPFTENEWVKSLAKVWITGNTSETRGGGIGSNGDVIFGTDKKPIDIPVRKVWQDRNNAKKQRPEKIVVELLAKLEGDDKEYVIETRELNQANGWKTEFKGLPTENAGQKILYSVKEITVAGYETTITGDMHTGFIITNKPEKPPTPSEKFIEIPVEKIWKDDGHEDKRPTEITVTLYANGVSTEKTLVLDASNGWKGVFRNLPEKKDGKIITYTVKEVEVKGYESVRAGNQHDGFVLTNTYKPEKPPTPPTPPTPPIPPIPPMVRIPRAGA